MVKRVATRENDYSEWYNDLVLRSGLAEYSAVKGSMVIKPYGFAIWETIQSELDRRFKETGHQNAYFPLFIPKSFFSKEASHVEGFAKECAVVTHYRLKMADNGKDIVVDPSAKLEEELIVRPTSETIIWHSYKNWIQSYRDLPILLNQWANVVRWEMRTRLFLRTSEFLWQEGHTAHASKEEAIAEARLILDLYAEFAENVLAMPVLKGYKSPNERFAGALDTYCIEALMQDGKALQAGTSHFLGQNFAKAFDVKFLSKEGKQEYVWATSWGVSTRLIGGLIMTHSDDKGLILPPSVAPKKVVIVPVFRSDDEKTLVNDFVSRIINSLQANGISYIYDDDDTKKPGWKYAEYELKGVPLRIVVGPRDVAENSLEIVRRDNGEKIKVSADNPAEIVKDLLKEIQQQMFAKAVENRDRNTHHVDNYDEFKAVLEDKAGFIWAYWDGSAETEMKIKEETKATIRLIPLEEQDENGHCIYSGKQTKMKVLFARAY